MTGPVLCDHSFVRKEAVNKNSLSQETYLGAGNLFLALLTTGEHTRWWRVCVLLLHRAQECLLSKDGAEKVQKNILWSVCVFAWDVFFFYKIDVFIFDLWDGDRFDKSFQYIYQYSSKSIIRMIDFQKLTIKWILSHSFVSHLNTSF